MNSTRYLDASEVPICADSWTTTDNQGMTPLQRAPPPADAMDCRSLPPLSHYHRSRRCTPTPTRRSLALGDSFVANDPNTVRKVHELDAEALALQRKLEDDETHRKPSGRLPPVRPRAEQDSRPSRPQDPSCGNSRTLRTEKKLRTSPRTRRHTTVRSPHLWRRLAWINKTLGVTNMT